MRKDRRGSSKRRSGKQRSLLTRLSGKSGRIVKKEKRKRKRKKDKTMMITGPSMTTRLEELQRTSSLQHPTSFSSICRVKDQASPMHHTSLVTPRCNPHWTATIPPWAGMALENHHSMVTQFLASLDASHMAFTWIYSRYMFLHIRMDTLRQNHHRKTPPSCLAIHDHLRLLL